MSSADDLDDWETAAEASIDEKSIDPFAGEDQEEEVNQDWDAEPVPKSSTPQPAKPAVPVLSDRKKKKLAEEEKRKKEAEELAEANDPNQKSKKKMLEEKMARERDAVLAGALLGVDTESADYVAPVGNRDDGSNIADGVSSLSAEEKLALKKSRSIEDFSFDDEAALEELAKQIVKKAVLFPTTAKQSAKFLSFLKTISNGVCDVMKVEDIALLQRFINVKHTEQTNKTKIAQKGKKAAAPATQSKKANTVKVSGSSSGNRNLYGEDDGADYNNGNDEDFM